jgi:hypothetical protein
MATSVLFYEATPGNYRGVYIGHMGHTVPTALASRFDGERAAIVGYIERGIGRGGYRLPGDEFPLWMEADKLPVGGYITNAALTEADVDCTWFLQEDGSIILRSRATAPGDPRAPLTFSSF